MGGGIRSRSPPSPPAATLGGVRKDQSVGRGGLPVVASVEVTERARLHVEAVQERLPLVFVCGDSPRFVRRVVQVGGELAFPVCHTFLNRIGLRCISPEMALGAEFWTSVELNDGSET